jgi:hypothetical protein
MILIYDTDISVTLFKHNSQLPDDGPCEVRNMLEWILTF